MTQLKPGRNLACPCGSGRKFKKCCGQQSSQSAAGLPPPADHQHLRELAELMNMGQYADAERQARALIDRGADHGPLWKIYGAALQLQGLDAVRALTQAARRLPDDAEILMFLGGAYNDRGEWTQAARSLRRSLQIDPHSAPCHDALGQALLAQGQAESAIGSFQDALRLQPQFAQAYGNLGNAWLDLGQFERAADSFRNLLRIDPRAADAHDGLGTALLGLRQLEASAESYRRAIALRPESAGSLVKLGSVLRDLGRLTEAIACCERALALRPELAEAHRILGNTLFDLGRFDHAENCYRLALKLEPEFTHAHAALAMLLRQTGRSPEADIHCRRALALEPRNGDALALLAEIQADLGDFAAAGTLFDRALEVDASLPEAWAGKIRYRKMQATDRDWIPQVQGLLCRPLAARHRVVLGHALGKFFDDVGDFENAFHHHHQANAMSKRLGVMYERERLTRYVEQIEATFDRRWLDALRRAGRPDLRPVFVVGMPRSGTTLVEQILASHPAVFGAGELWYWNRAAARYEGTAPLHSQTQMLSQLAHDYLELLSGKSEHAERCIDKMPANFWNLGMIHAALPGARIIHLQRHPLDTCLSIYFQVFSAAHSYAYDLDDLAHHYLQYRRLMRHWRATLPADALLDLPYESLVQDPEYWTRRMLEFVGLPWHSACLEFHGTRRVVQTASNWQVRQKISTASIGRWQHYRRFIGPLLSLIESDGSAVPA